MTEVKKHSENIYIIPRQGEMKTEAIIFASDEMIDSILADNAHRQIMNVATLKGIVGKAAVMPDIHYGYGFPIGGVAAFDADKGIISPGGIGYDINCGVRLAATNLNAQDTSKKEIEDFLSLMYNKVPSGVGKSGALNLNYPSLEKVLEEGSKWALKQGFASQDDIDCTEEKGCLEGADASTLSKRAKERGRSQLGTLGAGNHFLEIQRVSDIYDPETAARFGIDENRITVMIHSGSRGLGFQVCDDYLKVMRNASLKYNIKLNDRQLACAPFKSEEGRRYFKAMQCAANYAWVNRQIIMHRVRECARKIFGGKASIKLIYDVCHNIGKEETHGGKKLIVHRKGATRSFAPGRKEVPEKYRPYGQPVIIPGTMGTSSYLMKGTRQAMQLSFGSTAHGAGRLWSRSKAKRSLRASDVTRDMKGKGVFLMAKSFKTIAEEAPSAYKDVSKVIEVCHNAGLSEKVAKLIPLAVMKG
ncbi:MAG: RtcB family protein [Elusimicrobiota bacterium]